MEDECICGDLVVDTCSWEKGKNMLIKHDIPRYVETISGNMKTAITFMKGTI
jgi:hypothetical protein